MNLKEIKIKLDKLNRYFDFLNSLDGKISSLEKDAFLGQLRELYDIALFEDSQPEDSTKEKTEIVSAAKETSEQILFTKEEPVKKSPTFIFNETVNNEIVKKENPTENFTEKKVDTAEEVIKENIETPVLSEKTTLSSAGLLPENKEERISVEEIVPVELSKDIDFNGDFEELFIFKQATDLAAKLSEAPIANLSKALGVNEKLYYLRELFAGDTSKFNDSLEFFNHAGIFEKARAYMESNLIENYAWMSKEKKNIAKEFIKIIRRRYL